MCGLRTKHDEIPLGWIKTIEEGNFKIYSINLGMYAWEG